MIQSVSQIIQRRHPLVLVADDDLAVRHSLKFALELEGLEVHAFESGDHLLNDPELEGARCIVLDYHMPTMDGLAVLAQLKARHLDPPVVLITAYASDALRRRAARAGVRRFVEKPLLDGALFESVESVLAERA